MSVKAGTIENREQDLTVENRVVSGGRPEKATIEEQLQALRQRIRAGLAAPPEGAPVPECRDCYRRGWMAALKALEG